MQRLEGDDHLNGRAIRIRDDVPLGVTIERLRVHFRHDQRHVGIHPEMRRIVDHNTSGGGRPRGVFSGYRAPRREEAEVSAFEIKVIQCLHGENVVFAVRHFLTDRRFGRERNNFIRRKIPFMQDIQDFAAHIPCGACDGNFVTHGSILVLIQLVDLWFLKSDCKPKRIQPHKQKPRLLQGRGRSVRLTPGLGAASRVTERCV